MEFKSFKAADISISERKIIGYAATFGNVDRVNDIIKPGAFKKTIRERGKQIKIFYNHITPIGRPEILKEDEKGLYTEAILSRTAKADEVLELVKDGVITDMSIAYEAVEYNIDNNTGTRTLKELKLYELGPVDFAANEQAMITGVKTLADRLAQGQPIDTAHLSMVRNELKALLDVIESATGAGISTPNNAGPSIDTRIAKLPEEWCERLAKAFKVNN